MNYNTERQHLRARQYGRSVQDFVQHLKTIEDPEKRQTAAEALVEVIIKINHADQPKNEELRHKVWIQIFRIAGYDLEVTPPLEIVKPEGEVKPEPIPYPRKRIRHLHYGANIQRLIEKASGLEDEILRLQFAEVVGAYMKMSYKNFNQENINDEVIREDLYNLSDGKLQLFGNVNLDAYFANAKAQSQNVPVSTGGKNHKRAFHHVSNKNAYSSGNNGGTKEEFAKKQHANYNRRPKK